MSRRRKAAAGKTLGDTQVDAVKYAWFSNPVFRRAVSMAVDRDAIDFARDARVIASAGRPLSSASAASSRSSVTWLARVPAEAWIS